jgi:hypothetical protein
VAKADSSTWIVAEAIAVAFIATIDATNLHETC